MRRYRVGALSSVVLTLAAACTSFGTEPGQGGTPDTDADAPPTPIEEAPDGSVEARDLDGGAVNLLENGDFEGEHLGCRPPKWSSTGYQATLTRVADAYRGKYACKVCPKLPLSPEYFTIDPGLVNDATARAGERYAVRVWARTESDGGIRSFTTVRGYQGRTWIEAKSLTATRLSASWTHLEFEHTLADPRVDGVGGYVTFLPDNLDNPPCVLVDDFEIVRVQ
jgi:hypothetical protein